MGKCETAALRGIVEIVEPLLSLMPHTEREWAIAKAYELRTSIERFTLEQQIQIIGMIQAVHCCIQLQDDIEAVVMRDLAVEAMKSAGDPAVLDAAESLLPSATQLLAQGGAGPLVLIILNGILAKEILAKETTHNPSLN